MVSLDQLDRVLLRELLRNSRRSIRELARSIGVPASTLHDRLKKLMNQGVIKGFTVVLDEAKLGYTVKALILVNVEGKHIIEVEEEIAKHPNVQMVLDVTGEFDVAVIVTFKSIEELDRFVKNLLKNPYVKQTRTSIVFRVIKHSNSIPL